MHATRDTHHVIKRGRVGGRVMRGVRLLLFMNMPKPKRAVMISTAYFLPAVLVVIIAFGVYPGNSLLFTLAMTAAFPWSVAALLSSMLLIHISSEPLDTLLMNLMIVGVLINAGIIYLLTARRKRGRKNNLRST
jgi:hypothetical protein